jgi:diguanylate cyclase (GGDEF)-like protein
MLPRILKQYKKLEWLAYHDSLTKLKNRNWFQQNKNNIKCKYVYFIDINNLREINKRGHTIGDAYICSVIRMIKPLIDIEIIRYAGDEFIIFSNNPSLLKTCVHYAVGKAIVTDRLSNAIRKADMEMIKEKITRG